MSLAGCAPISSGSAFLKSSLANLECAGQAIGTLGFNGLTQPGSALSQLLLAALTLFIAWQGVRLMFGQALGISDALVAVAKIGLVLTLMTSWPAVRTLIAQPSFAGPSELVGATRLGGDMPLEDRLQRADDGIVALTKWGTGKLDIRAGRTAEGQPAASEFTGIALTDSLALGLGRLCFLIGALMSLGLTGLLGGAMISALPIFAGLLLFDATRSLFMGWVRLMFGLFVASFVIPLILMAELSLLEPWLARAIEQRSQFLATPSAPTELLALSASFLLMLAAAMALIIRACLSADFGGAMRRFERAKEAEAVARPRAMRHPQTSTEGAALSAPTRAELLAMNLGRWDQPGRYLTHGGASASATGGTDAPAEVGQRTPAADRRRSRQRVALSHSRRDQR